MEMKEWPKGHGEYFVRKRSLSRQRVRARHRPENISTLQVDSKSITRRERLGIGAWLHSWPPWYATPEGGRL